MPPFLFVCLATLSLVGGQPRAATPDTDVIRQREQERVKYLTSGQIDRLAQMTSPTLSYSHSNGAIDAREKYLDDLRSKRVVFRALDHRDVNIRFLTPEVAVLNGLSEVDVTVAGQGSRFLLRFTIIYVKQDGQWLFEAWHSTRVQ